MPWGMRYLDGGALTVPERARREQVRLAAAAIETFIDGWNDRCHPFTLTKTADEILPKCRPGKRTSFTRH
jgi:hypothetical protein